MRDCENNHYRGGARRIRSWVLGVLAAVFLLADAAMAHSADEMEKIHLIAGSNVEHALAKLQAFPEDGAEAVQIAFMRGSLHLNTDKSVERDLARLKQLAESAQALGQVQQGRSARLAARCLQLKSAGGRIDSSGQLAAILGNEYTDAPGWLQYECSAIVAGQMLMRGEYLKALPLLRENLVAAERMGSQWRRALTLSKLAYTAYRSGQHERAMQLSRDALQLAPEMEALGERGDVYTNIAWIAAFEPDMQPSRLELMEAANQAWREGGSERNLARGLVNLADVHLGNGDYREALQTSEQLQSIIKRLPMEPMVVDINTFNRGVALIGLGRTTEGLLAARTAIANAASRSELQLQVDLVAELANYLEKTGHLAEAIAQFRQYRELNNEIQQNIRQEDLQELQAQYDEQDRQVAAARLRDEAAWREKEVKESQRTLWLWAVLGVVVLGLLLFALSVFRRMYRAEAELRASMQVLERISSEDSLTGLANRRSLRDYLHTMPLSGPGWVVMLDIDHFKQINDEWGHASGDEVLRHVAGVLADFCAGHGKVFRWGGEEFLLLVAGAHEAGPDLAAALLDRFAGTLALGDASIPAPTASLGIAAWPQQRLPEAWASVIAEADAALYGAKLLGRNRAIIALSRQAQPLDADDAAAAIAAGAWMMIEGRPR